ncbi:MAG TPA: tRNA uridine-5-carboxymethylaminomethyl(34) synthesis GTPase MnmE [Moorella mulderi]|nr:tRNA uridine-5-carboxymethylaminomethyl(34) synthesis GTPase MnmE [Moorella mulderi]
MLEDTIVAPATPPGEGAIAIIRLSGPGSLAAAEKVFQPSADRPLRELPARTPHLGYILDPERGSPIDQCLLSFFPAPRSYTGEDMVELYCHGNPLVVERVLEIFLYLGARLADPGEFTKRAFLNGKLDLAQAEAVADIVRARTVEGLTAAVEHLQGKLSSTIKGFYHALLGVLAALEASIDFPEEVGEPQEIHLERLMEVKGEVEELLSTWEEGRILTQGIKLVLVGRPNVGKSSLLNALLQQERVLVSPIPGTTRDSVSEDVMLGGIPCRLIDTAGLRAPEDVLESMGVARTRKILEEADLILLVIDLSKGLLPEDMEILKEVRDKPLLVVANKLDLVKGKEFQEEALRDLPWVAVSALTGEGLERLREKIRQMAYGGRFPLRRGSPVLLRVRHKEALTRASFHLEEAIRSWREGQPPDIIAVDVGAAARAVGEVIGATLEEDLLDRIFADFCLGK